MYIVYSYNSIGIIFSYKKSDKIRHKKRYDEYRLHKKPCTLLCYKN